METSPEPPRRAGPERILDLPPRELSIGEQRAFEHGFHAALALVVVGAVAYVWNPLPPELRERAPLTLGAFAVATVLAILRWEHRRGLSTRLDASGVRIWYDDFTTTLPPPVPWSELVGYRDDRVESVVLVRRRRKGLSRTLAIPTHGEADRTAVLAFLDEQGIPRLESS